MCVPCYQCTHYFHTLCITAGADPSPEPEHTLRDTTFTHEEIILFQRQLEEGYDLLPVGRYSLWLKMKCPGVCVCGGDEVGGMRGGGGVASVKRDV